MKNSITAPPSAPVGVSSTEREWLQYAIDHMRDDNEPEDATCADVLEALLNRVESAPVGVEDLSCCGGNDEEPKSHCMDCSRYPGQLAQQPAAVPCPHGVRNPHPCRECEDAPSAPVGVGGFDKRFAEMLLGILNDVQDELGFTDEDKLCANGSAEIVAEIRELKRVAALAQQPAAAGEEIMVNAPHDVYTLPLQPSGLSSGPRFVVHVPDEEGASPWLT